jgi:hypothetical protein
MPSLFTFSAHHHGFCPQQRKAVCNLLLQDDSEGPTLIDYAARKKSSVADFLLVEHSPNQLYGKFGCTRPTHLVKRIQTA